MIAFKNIAPLQRVIIFEHRSFQAKYQVFRTNTTVFIASTESSTATWACALNTQSFL